MSMPPPDGPPIAPPPGAPPPPPMSYEPEPGAGAVRLAGFWQRFAGYLLDQILYGALASVFVLAGGALIAARNCYVLDGEVACYDEPVESWSVPVGVAIMVFGGVLAVWLYLRALGRTGRPWGARLAGLKVVRADSGEPIGFGRALGRTLFANIISANILYLGYLWMLWDPRKQTWQDKVVRSLVIRV